MKVRPIKESGLLRFRDWIKNHSWDRLLAAESAHEKAEILQCELLSKIDEFLPEKLVTFCSDDKEWFTTELKELDKKRKREYRKNRKSGKWESLNKKFKNKVSKAKSKYYEKMITNLREGNPGQWYSKLKRMTSYDQHKSDQIICEEISDKSDQEQAEILADKFQSISNEYQAIQREDISIPPISEGSIPKFSPSFVLEYLAKIKTNKASPPGDVPPRIIKEFAEYLSVPMSNILDTCVTRGEYPNIWKVESQTPVPKVHPPLKVEMLRNLSILKNFDRISQKILGELMMTDMMNKLDPSQFGNIPGVSTQHYLMKMIHQILTKLDTNQKGDTFAVIAAMIDWKEAFPRQCPILGVEAFIASGVRSSIIPLLINFFQDRTMTVKWHGKTSKPRNLKGSGPQGGTLGIIEYLAQSNDNADCVSLEERFKFVDDLTILEVINLLIVGLTSFNIRGSVPTDIPTHNGYIPPENLQTQKHIDQISQWTDNQKMRLNEKKSKIIIFNFTEKQFTTRLNMKGAPLEVLNETKLLGTIIQNDLKWGKNTAALVKKANARMELLRKMSHFKPTMEDMKTVHTTYIRSVLEQSCVVWHSSLTQHNRNDLERVQKNALRIILGNKYISYKNALEITQLKTLDMRREELSLKFAKNCLKIEHTKKLFPLNNKTTEIKTRNEEKYQVLHANTNRLKYSTVPFLQRILNKNTSDK